MRKSPWVAIQDPNSRNLAGFHVYEKEMHEKKVVYEQLFVTGILWSMTGG
jgi:hypothetical protein